MRRRRGLSVASKILGRGASSSPPPFQFPCLRTTPTTPTRSTMSTHCSAQSGPTRALAPQGRPWPLDRLKVNHAWFLFAISSPPLPFLLSFSLSHSALLLSLLITSILSFCDLTSFLHPSFPPSSRLFVRHFVPSSVRPSVRLLVRLCVCFCVPVVFVRSQLEQFHIRLTLLLLNSF